MKLCFGNTAFLLMLPLMTAAAVTGNRHLIYTQTNSDDPIRGNEILALHHNLDSAGEPLTVFGRFPTGGVGSNSPLGSQDSMIVHNDRLLSVNPNSNDISVFDMDLEAGGTLTLTHIEPSMGQFPVGLAAHNDLVYVLNTWDQGSIVGYKMNAEDGQLTPINNSTRILNAYPADEPRFGINTEFGNPGLTAHESPSQIGFSPDGGYLIAFNKGSDHSPDHEGNILVYSIDQDTGLPSVEPVQNVSTAGNIRPFSFVWIEREGRDIMLRTEADGRSASAFRWDKTDGSLTPITEGVSNGDHIGICWNAVHDSLGIMYGTNAPNATISSFKILEDGGLELLGDGVAYAFDSPLPFPFDVQVEGNYLYSVQAGSGSVAAFEIDQDDGSLSLVSESFSLNTAAPAFDEKGGLLGLRGGTAGGLLVLDLPESQDMEDDAPCTNVHKIWGKRKLRGSN